jgi:hypothetical protein
LQGREKEQAAEELCVRFLVVVDRDGIEVLILEDLTTICTTDVIDAVAASDDFRSAMLANGFHKAEVTPILIKAGAVSRAQKRGGGEHSFRDPS